MKKIILCVAIFLAGCAAQPSKEQVELSRYMQTVRPMAGISVKWSEYYEGLYLRDQAVGADGETLLRINDAIRLAKRYESGQMTKDEFEDGRRVLNAQQKIAIDEQLAQQRAARARAGLAFAAAMKSASDAAAKNAEPTYKIVQPAPTTTTNTTCNSFGGQLNCTSRTQ